MMMMMMMMVWPNNFTQLCVCVCFGVGMMLPFLKMLRALFDTIILGQFYLICIPPFLEYWFCLVSNQALWILELLRYKCLQIYLLFVLC